MSSFGDSDNRTTIEESLSWIAREYYSEDISEDTDAKLRFILDTLDVLKYICGEW